MGHLSVVMVVCYLRVSFWGFFFFTFVNISVCGVDFMLV